MKHLKKFLYVLALTGLLVFVPRTQAQTQPPKIMVTWRAAAYAPPTFSGKVLPTANTRITASFEVLDGGRVADVSRETVYWYVDGNLIENRPGVQTVVFRVPEFSGPTFDLRVELPGYAGAPILKTVEIPVRSPEAVLDVPFPSGVLTTLFARLRALPYFFNTQTPTELSFFWSVNGVTPLNVGDPTSLTVNLPPNTAPGSSIEAALVIKNPKDTLEAGTGSAKLIYAP